MIYWTKDVVVDPLDASGNTWFACVFTEWGMTRQDGGPSRGGLYRTTDRGVTWSPRLDGIAHDADMAGEARVESISILPRFPSRSGIDDANGGATAADVYLTTEGAGLWHSVYSPAATARGAGRNDDPPQDDPVLSFASVPSYPFNHPLRVMANPYNRSEVWVSSFGNGLYLGVTPPKGS